MAKRATVRAGYFVRGEELPEQLDPRYDVVVVPWRTLWQAEDAETVRGYQAAGIAVHVHVPFSYIHPTHTPNAHRTVRAVLDAHDGWLLGAGGERVGPEWKLIDPRSPRVRRDLLSIHVGLLNDAQWAPDGLFLDFLWDTVAWQSDFAPWSHEQRETLDNEYRRALYQLATGLMFRLRKAGSSMVVYGNGGHRCTALDGIVYEGFPHTKQEDGHRGLDVALWGEYGKATWEMFHEPPMLLPTGGDHVAYNIPAFRVIEAVGFAASYCPGAIVFDNGGLVFRAIGDLAR